MFLLLILARVTLPKPGTHSPALPRTLCRPHCPVWPCRPDSDVWTFSCLVMLNRHIIKKYTRLLTFPITSWTPGGGRTRFFKGNPSCYPTECPFSPQPLLTVLNTVYILPHTGFSWGWQWHGRKSCLFLSETTSLVQQNNANSAEKAFIMQNGWTHHAFFCNRL